MKYEFYWPSGFREDVLQEVLRGSPYLFSNVKICLDELQPITRGPEALT